MGIKYPRCIIYKHLLCQIYHPEGAKLFIYSKDRSYLLGAFTSANMQDDGQFGVDIIPGEEIVVEYNEPADAEFKGQLNIFRITHAYRDLFKVAEDISRGSATATTMLICPVGDPWRNEYSALSFLIVLNGNGSCTGALINNTMRCLTPYFLTARHCGGGIYFGCSGLIAGAPVLPDDVGAPTNQSISGATLRASFLTDSDFSLLQLNSTPPSSYNVCYAGWSRSNVPPTSGACVCTTRAAMFGYHSAPKF